MAKDIIQTGRRTQPRTYLDEVDDLNAQAKDFSGALPGAQGGEESGDLAYYRTKGGLLKPPGLVLPPAWRIGDIVHKYHFTEPRDRSFDFMREGGVRFSDRDTPFPLSLRYPCFGTWGWSTGFISGYLKATVTGEEEDSGPGIIIPLHRSSNWKLTVRFIHASQLGGNEFRLNLYAVTGNQKLPFWSMTYDLSAAVSTVNQRLYYNFGNDTFGTATVSSGLTASNSAVRTVAIARHTAAFGIYYDPGFTTYPGTWQWYQASPNSASYYTSYTEAFVGIQVVKVNGITLSDLYIESIELEYTV